MKVGGVGHTNTTSLIPIQLGNEDINTQVHDFTTTIIFLSVRTSQCNGENLVTDEPISNPFSSNRAFDTFGSRLVGLLCQTYHLQGKNNTN